MSLKALAEKVLKRDAPETIPETNIHIMSHSSFTGVWDSGTALPPETVANFEAHAAMLVDSCGLSRVDAEFQALKELSHERRKNDE